ncbi:MAG: hemerythrin family protein [Deferribacteraceae bacterium]|nr:hemerythrin family protein [Deferribacteraceae bacterium]
MTFELLDIQRCTFSKHEELDAQQERYVEKGNVFLRAFNKRSFLSVVEPTIIYLTDYTKEHFVTQEAFMALHQYPAIENHVVEHNRQVREVARSLKSLLQYKAKENHFAMEALGMTLTMLITDWFEFHILETDTRLNEFIRFEIRKVK